MSSEKVPPTEERKIQTIEHVKSGFTPKPDWRRFADTDHFVQFYEKDAFLLNSLSSYLSIGLFAGDACIVITTVDHRSGLEERLQTCGVDLERFRACGQYVWLDAGDYLMKLLVDGQPAPDRFASIVGGAIDRASSAATDNRSRAQRRVRVFGEMVSLLWNDGNHDGALGLERLWNDLAKERRFALFCAYPINCFKGESVAGLLESVCAEHAAIIPAESYSELANDEDRLRSIVLLQQQATSLRQETRDRHYAEQKLRISELRYQRLFEASKEGIVVISGHTMKIVDANPAAAELLAVPRRRMIGKALPEIGLPCGLDPNFAMTEISDAGVVRTEDLQLQTPDGRTRDVELTASVFEAAGERVVLCNLRDITLRKQAEDALRSVRDQLEIQVEDLRRLHEMSVSLTSSLDIQSVLEEVLRAALAVQGTDLGLLSLSDDRGEGLVLKVSRGFDEDFLQHVFHVPAGCGACGTCFKERERVVVEDVETDPIFSDYREAALKAGFRSCHSTPLVTRGGDVIGVLSVHFRMRHRPSEREIRLIDLYARMAVDIIENARLHYQMQRELETRKNLLMREQIARSEAETASRLKDEFLATVSHELRTPLNAIIGWSHMLRQGGLDDVGTARAIETIERNAKAQAQLIEDILDVSRIITGKLRLNTGPVDMAAVINAAIDSVQLAADAKNIRLEVTLDPSARHISGDSSRLQQVVWNLLSNAIKFTPFDGRVEVRLERAGSDVKVSVSDTGQGITPDFLPFIFDRFRQADSTSTRRHGGLGLGLAIVRHLVELHGGSLTADSAGQGLGSTFSIRLSMAGGASERIVIRQRGVSGLWGGESISNSRNVPSLRGIRVLLVDDDFDSLQLLRLILGEQNAEVQTASSATEAMDILEWFRADVVVSDLAMPGEDGYSLIRKIRARETGRHDSIAAIALTAFVRVEDRAKALTAGFNMFVPKPVEPRELIEAIANLAGASLGGGLPSFPARVQKETDGNVN
jgi:PAS domain S-box-containing protein